MTSVTFNCGGEKLVVNPDQVSSIQPYENSPTKTLLTVLGHTYKVRGAYKLIRAALGWEDGPVVGFDTTESQMWEKMLLRTEHDKSIAADDKAAAAAPQASEKKPTKFEMPEPITVTADDEPTATASGCDLPL